jgi:proteic killer suppression protein
VEVVFRTKALARCYREHKAAVRAFGAGTARRYVERVNLIRSARSLAELLALPGLRGHPLKGNRAGQYAIRLDGFMRLILSLRNGPPLEICIEEVSKHYED